MNQIVVGAGFGDEGKGHVVNALVSRALNTPGREGLKVMVVRFNGGHQAGHTVVHKGSRHVFSSFGSGTLQGAPTYWGPACTFYPVAFMREYQDLLNMNVMPEIYVNPWCPVTTPFDVNSNCSDQLNLKHGTTGTGFGATIDRHEHHYKLFFMDLFIDSVLKIKLKNIMDYYEANNTVMLGKFLDVIKAMKKLATLHMAEPSILTHYQLIFEGAQGILLDQDYGFFPHVTRSTTTTKNALSMALDSSSVTYYVTRCYQTRHGNGPMTNRQHPLVLDHKNTLGETNRTNRYQGDFRVAPFDMDLFKYALDIDAVHNHGPKVGVVTCMDQIASDWSVPFTDFNEFEVKQPKEFLHTIRGRTGLDVYYTVAPDGDLEHL